MKKIGIFVAYFFVTFQIFGQNISSVEWSVKISANNIKNDVYQLASEKMEGRATGEYGQKLAARYIYRQFKEAGILSYQLNFDSLGYFQKFQVLKKITPAAKLVANGKAYEAYKDFSLTGFKNYSNDSLNLIFLGNVTDSSYKNRDYSNNAVAFVTPNLYAGPAKAFDIMNHTGTNIVFYCNPNNPHQIEQITENQKTVRKKQMILDTQKFSGQIPFDSTKHPKQYIKYKKVEKSLQGPVSTKIIAEIFNIKPKEIKKWGLGKPDKTKHGLTAPIALKFEEQFEKKQTENVIACIPGNGKNDEYIVLSAHYDHIGKYGQKIFYGANDNASGTAAMIEIARKIQKAVNSGLQLKRSIIFAAFTGEEKGLLGSKYFVETKTISPNKIIANLNLDMLGRVDDKHKNTDFIYLLGANDLNPKLKNISDSLNHIYPKLELDYSYDSSDNFFYAASDQASFVKRNIPAIFYFNGLHEDYHKPGDTPDKIDYELIRKVCALVFQTAIELANAE